MRSSHGRPFACSALLSCTLLPWLHLRSRSLLHRRSWSLLHRRFWPLLHLRSRPLLHLRSRSWRLSRSGRCWMLWGVQWSSSRGFAFFHAWFLGGGCPCSFLLFLHLLVDGRCTYLALVSSALGRLLYCKQMLIGFVSGFGAVFKSVVSLLR